MELFRWCVEHSASVGAIAAWIAAGIAFWRAIAAARNAKIARDAADSAKEQVKATEETAKAVRRAAEAIERGEEQRITQEMTGLAEHGGIPEFRRYFQTLPERFGPIGEPLLARAIAAKMRAPEFLRSPEFAKRFSEAARLLRLDGEA